MIAVILELLKSINYIKELNKHNTGLNNDLKIRRDY